MKKNIFYILLLVCLLSSSCGWFSSAYDRATYKSITGETGDIYVLSGGKIMFKYKNAKILYSSSDSQSMLVKVNGERKYIQGDAVIELKLKE